SRPASRQDHAPDLGDPAVDVEDASFEAVCQIDLQPEPQPFAARAQRQPLDAAPNFAKGEDAQIESGLVLVADPSDDVRIGVGAYQFGDDIRVEKVIR